MNKEDYVSLEVAKLLKEKGFNEPCDFYYKEFKTEVVSRLPRGEKKEEYESVGFSINKVPVPEYECECKCRNSELNEWQDRGLYTYTHYYPYSMPTLYEAQKWLRTKFNIDVLPIIRQESPKKDYCCYIYKDAKVVRCKVAYGEDFYECMNDGLFESLKII